MSDATDSTCPVCRRRGPWRQEATTPFCSPRCRQVDLGRWFGGGYTISEPLRPEHFAEDENLPPGRDPDGPANE